MPGGSTSVRKEQIYFLGTSKVVVGKIKVEDPKITRVKVSKSIYLHLLKRFSFQLKPWRFCMLLY